MRLNVTRIDDNRRIVVGKVKSVKVNDKVATVELEGETWNRDEKKSERTVLSIDFWNNDKVKMADMVKAAKVAEGSVISVEVYEKDGKVTGNRFKYKGHYTIPATETTKEKNVFMGVVSSMYEDPDGRYVRVTVPINENADEETKWTSITFFNNESANLADRASKCLGGRNDKKARAIIVCGPNRPYNGRDSYSAYDFVLID